MMNSNPLTPTPPPAETGSAEPATTPAEEQAAKGARRPSVQPVLEKLFELYPQLFGADFLPLKLGVFQELLERHPGQLERASLKIALGIHTRSTPYLKSVAAGKPRYNLQGEAVEPVAPEHVHLALLELFRRRQGRSPEDLRPRLRKQMMAAFEASGLTRQDYLARVQGNDVQANQLLDEAFAERDQSLARQEALLGAFRSSGKNVAEFAAMYGLDPRDVSRSLAPRG